MPRPGAFHQSPQIELGPRIFFVELGRYEISHWSTRESGGSVSDPVRHAGSDGSGNGRERLVGVDLPPAVAVGELRDRYRTVRGAAVPGRVAGNRVESLPPPACEQFHCSDGGTVVCLGSTAFQVSRAAHVSILRVSMSGSRTGPPAASTQRNPRAMHPRSTGLTGKGSLDRLSSETQPGPTSFGHVRSDRPSFELPDCESPGLGPHAIPLTGQPDVATMHGSSSTTESPAPQPNEFQE